MIGATVVAVFPPPVGVPLVLTIETTYGALELGTTITGKDWLSGKELGTGERWMRGLLSPLDIVPEVSGMKKFAAGARLGNQVVNLGEMAGKPGLKSTIKREIVHVGDMMNTAGKMTVQRVKSAGLAIKDAAYVAKNKLAKDIQDIGRVTDSAITSTKNITSTRKVVEAEDIGKVHIPAENTHFFDNKAKQMFSKAEDVKGTDYEKYSTKIDTKVSEIEKLDLPKSLAETFTDGNYRTVTTNQEVTVYRVFGGNADAGGGFVTTTPAPNRIDAKIESALLPEWKNTRMYEAKINIPEGEILNVGKVAPQTIKETGTVLQGGADQILMPRDWPLEWINDIRVVPSK